MKEFGVFIVLFVAFLVSIAWVAVVMSAEQDHAKQEACAAKGGTYFSREAKCLAVKEIK